MGAISLPPIGLAAALQAFCHYGWGEAIRAFHPQLHCDWFRIACVT